MLTSHQRISVSRWCILTLRVSLWRFALLVPVQGTEDSVQHFTKAFCLHLRIESAGRCSRSPAIKYPSSYLCGKLQRTVGLPARGPTHQMKYRALHLAEIAQLFGVVFRDSRKESFLLHKQVSKRQSIFGQATRDGASREQNLIPCDFITLAAPVKYLF